MRLSASNDNTASLASRQESIVKLKGVNSGSSMVTIEMPWSAVEAISQFIEVITLAADERNSQQEAQLQQKASNDNHVEKQRAKNRQLGRVWASELRRQKRDGLDRREAIKGLAQVFHVTPTDIEILVKHHNKVALSRQKTKRYYLLQKWENNGIARSEMAERLNVTRQQTLRLLKESKGGVNVS